MKSKTKSILTSAMTVLLITGMAAAAELLGNREILFPEIAAIAAGSLLVPQPKWKTDSKHILAMIAFGAVAGILIVRLLPLPQWMQMSAAFLLASLMLAYSGTTFAPAISAIVLPVMLGTESIVYPAAAIILTILILAMRKLATHLCAVEPISFTPEPLPDRSELADVLLRWCIGSAVIFLALHTGMRFAAAPPLLVAFTEFRKPHSAAHNRPFATGALLIGCAGCGALLRLSALALHIPAFPAAGLTALLVVLIMHRTQLFIPPAAALAILAYLIPAEAVAVYPLQIACGTIILIALALLHIEHLKVVKRHANI